MTLTKKNYRFFKYAKRASELSDFKKTPIGCVAVYKNRVISVGYNSHKTSPTQLRYNRYRIPYDVLKTNCVAAIHAEISCILQINNFDIDMSKVDLYIYRKCKNRNHGMSRPCAACMKFIIDSGIKNIYYTGDYSYIYEHVE